MVSPSGHISVSSRKLKKPPVTQKVVFLLQCCPVSRWNWHLRPPSSMWTAHRSLLTSEQRTWNTFQLPENTVFWLWEIANSLLVLDTCLVKRWPGWPTLCLASWRKAESMALPIPFREYPWVTNSHISFDWTSMDTITVLQVVFCVILIPRSTEALEKSHWRESTLRRPSKVLRT